MGTWNLGGGEAMVAADYCAKIAEKYAIIGFKSSHFLGLPREFASPNSQFMVKGMVSHHCQF